MNGGFKVIGIGRVGSYSRAKHFMRSKNHLYWAIAKWYDLCSVKCLDRRSSQGIHYPIDWKEDTQFGRFKTKKQAEEFLPTLINERN